MYNLHDLELKPFARGTMFVYTDLRAIICYGMVLIERKQGTGEPLLTFNCIANI